MDERTDARLARIEERLARLEQAIVGPAAAPAPIVTPTPSASLAPAGVPARRTAAAPGAGRLMAWGAALSFVLAAIYFIKLVHASGWLTPERQLALACVAGIALIGVGLWLARYDRGYASYLPAAGIVVLYLTTYGAHLYYQLIDARLALGAVASISIIAIALGAHFRRSAYAVLAGVCVYATPLVMDTLRSALVELALYFTAWSIVFCFCALYEARRLTYLVPMYLAFLGFDAAWRLAGAVEWQQAACYQFAQFAIFALTAARFSVRHAAPLTSSESIAHALPLLYFYVSEYALIRAHAPWLAPPLALASAVLVLALFVLARRRLGGEAGEAPSAVLVSAYCAGVTTHVVFFEWLPARWLAWAVLALAPLFVLLARQPRPRRPALLPLWIAGGGLLLLGGAQILVPDLFGPAPPAPRAALALYAGLLYALYFLPRVRLPGSLGSGVLYAAHGATMVLILRVLDGALAVSIAWALLAIAMMVIALRREDRVLGQSALVIYGASTLKVLLFDLSGTAPLIRIGVLIVLGVSLYAGGWLYQGLQRRTTVRHPDPAIDAQIARIAALADQGLDDIAIVAELERTGVACLAREGWTPALVAQIRADYALA